MATPHHPTALSSGSGKALALLPGGGGQVQPIHVFQSSSQPSVTMVRVVTSVPPNGYSAVGGVEGNSDLRGTAVWRGESIFEMLFLCDAILCNVIHRKVCLLMFSFESLKLLWPCSHP